MLLEVFELTQDRKIPSEFQQKVRIDAVTSCWEWVGYKFPKGYGQTRFAGKKEYAHRASYKFHFGEIPSGAHVLHTCDNRCCINPDHLFLGDNDANIADKIKKGRQQKGESHGRAILTESVAMQIKNTSKLSAADLAATHGVSPTQIRRIRSGQRWKHLTS